MGDVTELLTKLDDLRMVIIKVAEVLGIALICMLGLKNHYDRLRRRYKKRDRTNKSH